jgi:hypothetical protein
MKPKLLITLGCSWTEGVGCYLPPILYDTLSRKSRNELDKVVDYNQQENEASFRKKTWSNRVGKKLGFDKVINLGYSGTSNSQHVKNFYDWIEENPNIEKDYSILVIWLMTEPSRFSFYDDGKLQSFQPSVPESSELSKAYVKEIKDITIDSILEQKFYLKSLDSFCKLRDIDLITTSWHDTLPYLYKYLKSETYLYKRPVIMQPPKTRNDDGYLINYAFCAHPSEDGYKWIADQIVQGIKENHPKWYGETPNPNVECIWEGTMKKHKSILL